jgi:hypothetical protein
MHLCGNMDKMKRLPDVSELRAGSYTKKQILDATST